MAKPRRVEPVLLVVAVFSRHEAVLNWARERLEDLHGPVGPVSPTFDFHQTTYYEPTMGPGLRKRFLTFERLVPPDTLPDVKLRSNALELELANQDAYPEERPLNLDPGFLSLGKFCLATTKDQQHRLYLRDGIFAEVTLRFQAGTYEPWPWTYADYREEAVRNFLKEARDYYRARLADW
ncbi:MAG: DUF4416 family protein [Gemmataceae bacterium]|nr:DUF4416 family protein [Gemmataceae bacterium]